MPLPIAKTPLDVLIKPGPRFGIFVGHSIRMTDKEYEGKAIRRGEREDWTAILHEKMYF